MRDLIAFMKARLDDAERTVYAEGTPPNGVIAWLTYREADGSMGYTTVAHGHAADGPWVADGNELPEPADVLVVHDPERALRDITAKRARIERFERAAAAGGTNPSSFVRGQDHGYAEACLDSIRDDAVAWSEHPDYRQEWKP